MESIDFNNPKKRNMKMSKAKKTNKTSLAEALRGMRVKNWERRETSDGNVVVYVRYIEQEPILTTQVVEK